MPEKINLGRKAFAGISAFVRTLTQEFDGAPSDTMLNPVLEIDDCLASQEPGTDEARSWFFIYIAAIGGMRDISRFLSDDAFGGSTFTNAPALKTEPSHPCYGLLSAMAKCSDIVEMGPMLESFEIISFEKLSAGGSNFQSLWHMRHLRRQIEPTWH